MNSNKFVNDRNTKIDWLHEKSIFALQTKSQCLNIFFKYMIINVETM